MPPNEEIEAEPTESDAGGVGDAISAFVDEEDDEPASKPKVEAKPRAELAVKNGKAPEPKEETEEEGEEEKVEEPKEKRVYKHKVMGVEKDLDADQLDAIAKELGVDPKELLTAASLKKASYQKMAEAAELRKQVEQAREIAKKNPAAALKMLGLEDADYDRAAQERVWALYQQGFGPDGQPLTPEQKELAQLRSQVQSKKAQEEQAQQEAQQREDAQKQEELSKHWVKTIVGHMEKTGDPKSVLPRIAANLRDLVEHDAGLDPADFIEDAAAQAWEDVAEEHGKMFKSMPFEKFEARFPETVEMIRKGIVAKYRAKAAGKEPERQPEERKHRANGRRPMTSSSVLDDFASGG